MSIKACKTAVCASALMAVAVWSGGVFASVTNSFENSTTAITIGSAGTFGDGGPSSSVSGYPGNIDAHTKVLAITGTVTYTESDTPSSNASQVDLMFKAEPTDELDDLADQTDVKVALAVVTNGVSDSTVSVQLWCKAKNAASASWVKLCDVDNASWARATLVLDYTAGRCRVSINGDPQVTDSAVEDSWYTFANATENTYLQSVTMAGSTEVDDFVVTHTALDSYAEPFEGTAVTAGGVAITYDDLNKYGITKEQATANGVLNADSGMKISEKIEAGLNPKSATKFEMQTMKATSDTAATITFPGNKGASGYTVTATADAAGTGTVLDTATVTPGAANESGETVNSAAFSHLPSNDLIYFHLKTK